MAGGITKHKNGGKEPSGIVKNKKGGRDNKAKRRQLKIKHTQLKKKSEDIRTLLESNRETLEKLKKAEAVDDKEVKALEDLINQEEKSLKGAEADEKRASEDVEMVDGDDEDEDEDEGEDDGKDDKNEADEGDKADEGHAEKGDKANEVAKKRDKAGEGDRGDDVEAAEGGRHEHDERNVRVKEENGDENIYEPEMPESEIMDNDDAPAFTILQSREKRGQSSDGTVVAWTNVGCRKYAILRHGPRNIPSYTFEPEGQANDVIDITDESKPNVTESKIADKKDSTYGNRKYIHSAKEIKGIIGVVWKSDGAEKNIRDIDPSKKEPGTRYPITVCHVKWHMQDENGEDLKTWETRSSLKALYKKMTDNVIYDAAEYHERRYSEYHRGLRESEDRSPTVDPNFAKVNRRVEEGYSSKNSTPEKTPARGLKMTPEADEDTDEDAEMEALNKKLQQFTKLYCYASGIKVATLTADERMKITKMYLDTEVDSP